MSVYQGGFPDEGPSLREARNELLAKLDEGTTCPCCGQHAQRYRWSLPGSAARFLIRMYELGGTTKFIESKAVQLQFAAQRLTMHVVHIPAYWYLIENERERRSDGGKSGWWRVTVAGERFIQGGTIPKYAYVFDGKVEGHDGPPQTISDRLGHPFDWGKHMRGESE